MPPWMPQAVPVDSEGAQPRWQLNDPNTNGPHTPYWTGIGRGFGPSRLRFMMLAARRLAWARSSSMVEDSVPTAAAHLTRT
jgi:hypothetical protein